MRKWTAEQREIQKQKLLDFHSRRRAAGGRRGRIVLTRPGRVAKAPPLTLRDLPRLLEALELCDRIGWERARQLAAMFDD